WLRVISLFHLFAPLPCGRTAKISSQSKKCQALVIPRQARPVGLFRSSPPSEHVAALTVSITGLHNFLQSTVRIPRFRCRGLPRSPSDSSQLVNRGVPV